jgi:biotin transport system substrate-specific component
MLRFHKKTFASIIGMTLGMIACYLFGTIWLALHMSLTFKAALMIGVIPYLPGDAVKIALAAIIGPKLSSAIQKTQK